MPQANKVPAVTEKKILFCFILVVCCCPASHVLPSRQQPRITGVPDRKLPANMHERVAFPAWPRRLGFDRWNLCIPRDRACKCSGCQPQVSLDSALSQIVVGGTLCQIDSNKNTFPNQSLLDQVKVFFLAFFWLVDVDQNLNRSIRKEPSVVQCLVTQRPSLASHILSHRVHKSGSTQNRNLRPLRSSRTSSLLQAIENLRRHIFKMSVSTLSESRDKKQNLDPGRTVLSAQDIRRGTQRLAIVGIAFDVWWHHYLRQFYIGPPRGLQTFGVYAFWASVWYCASHSGDWTYAAIARDRDRIPAELLPAYDGIWDRGAVHSAVKARNVPLKREKTHWVAYASLTTVPVLARLTYAYRPWFWQRRLPFKVTWLCAAVFSSVNAVGFVEVAVESRKVIWEEHSFEQEKAG